MTGTSLPMARSRRHTSNPSRSGITTSSTIRSGRSASACRIASTPPAAVLTAQPWNLSATCTSSRMFGSSSTTSTCGIRSLSVITVAHSAAWPALGTAPPIMPNEECPGYRLPRPGPREAGRRVRWLPTGRPDEDEPGVLHPADHGPADPDRLANGERGLADLAAAVPDDRGADQLPGPAAAVGRLDHDGAAVHRLDHAPHVGERADGAVGGLEGELAVHPTQEEEPGDPVADETAAREGRAVGLRQPGVPGAPGRPGRPPQLGAPPDGRGGHRGAGSGRGGRDRGAGRAGGDGRVRRTGRVQGGVEQGGLAGWGRAATLCGGAPAGAARGAAPAGAGAGGGGGGQARAGQGYPGDHAAAGEQGGEGYPRRPAPGLAVVAGRVRLRSRLLRRGFSGAGPLKDRRGGRGAAATPTGGRFKLT